MGQIIVSDLKFKWTYSNLPFNCIKPTIVSEISTWLLPKKYRMVLGKCSAEENLHEYLRV